MKKKFAFPLLLSLTTIFSAYADSETGEAAQRKWIAYRDADCEFQTFPTTEGSVHGMLYSQCLTQKTAERVTEFKSMLSCKEGDLSCPL